jgi:hypothetical protein
VVLAAAATWYLQAPVMGAPPTGQVEGTISAVDAGTVTIMDRSGSQVRVALTGDTVVLQRSSATLETIKPNDFVGVTARREPDGSLTAISINIFPLEFRGRVREAQFVMETGNIMTNATVFQSVRRIEGRTLYLKVNAGSVVIAVPKDVEVSRLTVDKVANLRPGMRALVRGSTAADGTFVATAMTVDAR